jgi:hypothetical protein
MNKLYLLLAFCAIVCGAYFYGANIADAKCRTRVAQQNLESIKQIQNQIFETKRTSHGTVYKMGVGDIRRILRDKYSIGE